MSKFKVGDAVIPARGDVHDLFGHWMEYWAKDCDVRPTKFYVVGFSKDGEYVIYNADRCAKDGPHIPECDLQLAPKFAVGDKVRVIDNTTNGGFPIRAYEIGAVYPITSTCTDLNGSEAYILKDHTQYLKYNQIEPAYTSCAAAEVDNLADEYGAPKAKFKVGDRVKFRDDYSASCRGEEATVVKVNVWGDDGIQVDHNGDISTERAADLRHVAPAAPPASIADIVARHSQTGTAIVAVLEDGQPRPATRPYVHTTASAAETEANRLARTNPGKEFGVYTLGSVAKVERVYGHEWQRLAANGNKIGAIKELRGMTGLFLATAKDAVEDWLRREELTRAA